MESADSDKEYPCLIRVSDGDKVKFSTKVCLIQSNLVINSYIYHIGRTGPIRRIPRNLWKPPQNIHEHPQKARQKTRKATSRGSCQTQKAHDRSHTHRRAEEGQREEKKAKEDQGCEEAGEFEISYGEEAGGQDEAT